MATEEIQFSEVAEERCCDECGKKHANLKSKYCSNKCRKNHGVKMRKNKLNGTPSAKAAPDQEDLDNSYNEDHDSAEDNDYGNDDRKKESSSSTKLIGSLRGLDAQSQYIITHQRDMINDLKEERGRLRTKLEAQTTKRIELEKKLDRMELEETLQVKSKSGLNGISENPLVLKLAEHAAPALGAWIMKMVEKDQPSSQLTGTENLDPETQQQVHQINTWYATQPKEIQQTVYNMLDVFAETAPEQLPNLLKRVNNLFKHGTTATSSNQYTGNFN